jgi:signal transduction histidine kinase
MADLDKEYLKNKNEIVFAYIERSEKGEHYNDVYNEEIINLFAKKVQIKTKIIKGTLEELKKLKNIDIFIDPIDEISGYSTSKPLNNLAYSFYKLKDDLKNDNDFLKDKKLALLDGDKIPLGKLQRITNDLEIVRVKSIEEGFNLLKNKEIDLFFTLKDDPYMRLPKQKIFEKISQEKNTYVEKTIGVNSKDDKLIKIVNAFVEDYSYQDKKEVNEKTFAKHIWNLIELSQEEKEYLKNKSEINVGGIFKGLAPIIYFDDSNEINGVALEYIKIFEYGSDIKINFVHDYINGSKPLENQGKSLKIDFFLTASKEIKHEGLVLTKPYYNCTLGIFGKSHMGDTFFRNLNELSGKTIGIAHEKFIESFLETDTKFKLKSAEDISELYKMLKNGEIDYFIFDYNLMINSKNKKGINDLNLYGILDQDFTLSFATFKEDIILINIMDKILKLIDSEELFSKWGFKGQVINEVSPYRQWMIIFGIALLLLVPYLLILKNQIEKRKKVETKLLETKKELENALNIKTAFLANMSHELKTPLTAVLGFTNLLLKREDDLKKQQLLENIKVSGDTLVNFINDILDLSKLEMGKVELKYIRINSRKMIDDLERICRGLNKGRNVIFEVKVSENVPKYFMGDEVRLKEIILNLVNNAFKFTKTGKVEVEFDSSQDKLFIKIKDTGIGIPKDKIDSIFERYKQLDLNEDIEGKGFGLGLSIVKEIVNIMDGKIEVESKHKEGTIFKLTLPIKKKLQLVGSIRGTSN